MKDGGFTGKYSGKNVILFNCIVHSTLPVLHNIPSLINLKQKKVFPNAWRNSQSVPIYKSSKNKFTPEAYRPISLSNILCKFLEKIVNQWLTWYLEKINCLAQ